MFLTAQAQGRANKRASEKPFSGNHPSGENFVRKTACAFFVPQEGQSRTAEMIFLPKQKRKLSDHGHTIQPP